MKDGTLLFCFIISVIVSTYPRPVAQPSQVIQSGTAVLHFNGQDVAMTQVDFEPDYSTEPVIVCSPSNEWAAGILVGCQALNGEVAGISAQLPYTTTLTLEVGWIAVGDVTR